MIVSNTRYYPDIPFEEYQKLHGNSHSDIKGFHGEPTEGMRLGSRVHQYLNEPHEYDWHDAEIVILIARKLKSFIGDAYQFLEKELSFTADFEHNGLVMPYRGRADMIKPRRLIIDIKILAGDLERSIERFGYANQQSGYCLATGTPMSIIIAFNKRTRKIETKVLKPNAAFWEYQTVRLGEPKKIKK